MVEIEFHLGLRSPLRAAFAQRRRLGKYHDEILSRSASLLAPE
jgi:hypothetical protein